MNFASYKDRKAVAAALKAIYTAVDADAAELALAEFEESDLAKRYPAIAPSWRRAWNEVLPFLDYPPEVRRLIYNTNAIEALNSKIRRAVSTRGHFPSDDAAAKLIYLTLNATSSEWKRSVRVPESRLLPVIAMVATAVPPHVPCLTRFKSRIVGIC
ncbi:transposase, partial [Phaeobacter sp. SYSU ZJ3003]|uniref:transposase n=1 Tax=Phaeobacter sp. SYSU ZJ3003 TaxID=2109330 RepID=UPI00351C2144